MGEDRVHLPAAGIQRRLRALLGVVVRLLIRPPGVAAHQAVIFVHAVSTAEYKMVLSFQRVDVPVPRKEQVGVRLLAPDFAAVPIFQPVARDMVRPAFVVTVDAEDCCRQRRQSGFALGVPPVPIVIDADIPQNYERITFGQHLGFAKTDDPAHRAVRVAGIVDHGPLPPVFLRLLHYTTVFVP